ncbi:SAM hydrolase/SAM-dependent halogenase family protein [Phormidium sp. CCY1219]|uniref:SAM hydrolase/SAM-dependent halogenase family protein n=1 Tax=Phormidium sp. CCY1219 TaxID=2886104 RepID=UPI002D767327|nr:SAM-dependent chlorinase/fluorinase [Phormidium sp. CCY1219]
MHDGGILTLLTDFGYRDVYVGVMKGAIAQINPQVTVVDLTHDIPPQDVVAGRFCLMNAVPYFPEGTVHVAVVDPGVGSQRRAIAVQLANAVFVAPDNGLLTAVLTEETAIAAAVELTNPQYWRTSTPSTTFHGRDIFAPVGAHIARGVPLAKLGNPIDPRILVKLDFPQWEPTSEGARGCIQYVDRFGNLATNIPGTAVREQRWSVVAAGTKIPGGTTYSDATQGGAIALVGSHGWVEIAVNGGSARSQLQLEVGATVEVRWQ